MDGLMVEVGPAIKPAIQIMLRMRASQRFMRALYHRCKHLIQLPHIDRRMVTAGLKCKTIEVIQS